MVGKYDIIKTTNEKEFKMEIIQVLLYILIAIIILGSLICFIALIITLKSRDKERAFYLVRSAIVGLVSVLIILVIMLILIYYFKL